MSRSAPALPLAAATVVLALLLVPSGLVGLHGLSIPHADELTAALPPPAIGISDGGSAQTSWNNTTVTAVDTVGPSSGNLSTRAYTVSISTNLSVPGARLRVATYPTEDWGLAQTLPSGAQNLPSVGYWNWAVTTVEGSEGNWSANTTYDTLWAVLPWANATFQVVGTANVSLAVSVEPGVPVRTPVTALGLSLHDPTPGTPTILSDPDYANLVRPLAPSLLRFGPAAMASWNSVTSRPKFDFTMLDASIELAESVNASSYLNLPAGNWGDGNLLPAGMPLNLSLPMSYQGTIGYFPTDAAYESFVAALVNHTANASERVAYWNVGNEVPLVNRTEVLEFIRLFNVAAQAIHSRLPDARVGSDVMMDRTYLPLFATAARGVGFLSFHYYPSTGLCIVNGTYCAPLGGENGTPDPVLFKPQSSFDQQEFYPPSVAPMVWKNLTGVTLPVIDSESNLAGIGGSPKTASTGTDPRQQMLDGAAWLLATMVHATQEGMAALTYFALSGPNTSSNSTTWRFGGWGFGLSAPALGNGSDVRYAPWWAAELWAGVAARNASQVAVQSADPSVVQAVASVQARAVQVLLVNRVDTPVRVSVGGVPNATGGATAAVLDDRSYVEVFDSESQTERLVSSGVNYQNSSSAGPATVSIDGYGAALVTFHLPAAGNSTGNRSGSGSNSSGGTNSTNGTGPSGSSSRGGSGPATAPPHGVKTPPAVSSSSTPVATHVSPTDRVESVAAGGILFSVAVGAAIAGARAGGPDAVSVARSSVAQTIGRGHATRSRPSSAARAVAVRPRAVRPAR